MIGDPVLELRNVGLSYSEGRLRLLGRKKLWVLNDVSFVLNEGETLGLIGHNGVGKSTLLRLLAGIYAPDKGRIFRYKGRASLLSLNAGFVPHLTGRENAILSGILLGMSKKQVLKILDSIHEFSELGEFFDEPIHTYSSGMLARLGFSVAFQARSEILLIDEVLGVGDENFRIKSTDAMKQRIRENGTVILVSHSADTIKELCDRAVWIDNGRSEMDGPVDLVIDAYLKSQKLRREMRIEDMA